MARLIGTLMVLMSAAAVVAVDSNNEGDAVKADSMHPRLKIATTLGDIVLELDAEKAPITTLNFVQYAEDKYYDGTIFHRVISNFMIQGGGFTTNGKKSEGLRSGIKNEWENGLKNSRGSISMARLGGQPDSATAQFFINVVDNVSLDNPRDGAAYAVFGKVVEGMDTVEKIRNTKVASHPSLPGGKVPVEAVIIESVTLLTEFDRAKVDATVKATEGAADAAIKQAKAEEEKIVQDIIKKAEQESGATSQVSNRGLIYIDLKVGDGQEPVGTDKVEVHYTGWLLDGTKFDSSVDRGKPFVFSMGRGVISGWLEGVATMKVGGKRKLIIPPELAYGARGRPSIPPNSTLVFDIELLGIKYDD